MEASDPAINFGASDYLAADGGATGDESFVRFEVSGLTGAVTRATLRLYASSDTPDGPAVYAATGDWTEAGVTWNTKPALTTGPFGDLGAIGANVWVEFDVTALVQGNGTFDFGLAQPGSDGVKFNSREAATNRPQLVVTTGSSGAPAATSTPTATPGGTPSTAPTGCATTIQALVDAAASGSVVSVPSCVYRETVTITKPLVLDGGGVAEVRGSDVWNSGWSQSGGYWVRGTVPAFSTGGSCQSGTERCLWPEQVFFDGRPLLQVAANPASGQFAVNGARQVVLADDPNGHTVEVTTRKAWVTARAMSSCTAMTSLHGRS